MNILKLTLSNLKRYLKSPDLILPMILMPIILITGTSFALNSSDKNLFLAPIALVCNTDGKYEKELINELDFKNNIFDINDKNKAIELLKNNKIASVYILDENFTDDIENSKSPIVDSIKVNNGGGSIWADSKIDGFISNSLNKNQNKNMITTNIIDKETPFISSSFLPIFLICYLLYVTSSYFCQDLLTLKKSNVLKRMLATKNSDLEILLSLFLSLFAVQALVASFVLLITNKFNINLDMILLVVSNCFVSTSLIIFLSRVFKDVGATSIASTVYAIGNIFLCLPAILPSISEKLPLLDKLSMLSPFYWTFKALSDGTIYISLIALTLIGLAFITCGSFKLKDFARN